MCESPLSLIQFYLSDSVDPMCQLTLMSVANVYELTVADYLQLIGFTVLLEAPFYFLAIRGRGFWQFLAALALCNLATHPIVVFILPRIFASLGIAQAHELLTAETFAPLLEALLLATVWRVRPGLAVAAMIAGNLFSWGFGLWLLSQIA